MSHLALFISDKRRVILKKVATKRPKSGEILVSLITAGICGTDIQIINQSRSDRAKIIGHEGIGQIVDMGKNVTGFKIGQKVVFNPVNPFNQNDILGHSTNGIFQEYFLVSRPAIKWGLIVPFDNKVPLTTGSLIEPLATAVYGNSLVNKISRPKNIAVIGAGPIGILNAIYAKYLGAKNVFLINKSKARLDWAIKRKLIKPQEVILDSSNLDKTILEKTKGKGVDTAYLCTPRSTALSALRKALMYVRQEGCIDLVGGITDGDFIDEIPCPDLNKIRRANICGNPKQGFIQSFMLKNGKKIWLTGHRGASVYHFYTAMHLLAKFSQNFAKVISHTMSLTSTIRVLNNLNNSSSRKIMGKEYIKGIIDFSQKD